MTNGRSIWDSDALRPAPQDSPLVAVRDSKRVSKCERDGFGKLVRKDPVTPLFVAHPEHYCPEFHKAICRLRYADGLSTKTPHKWCDLYRSNGSSKYIDLHPDGEKCVYLLVLYV